MGKENHVRYDYGTTKWAYSVIGMIVKIEDRNDNGSHESKFCIRF